MADRRCFSKKVVESDAFRNLPDSVQALYFHLNMAADDDGFINCAGSVAARSPSGLDDLKQLVNARFILRFPGEIYVVKHWRISNSLKSDRMKAPAYPAIASVVWVESNRAYTDHAVPGCRTLYEVRTGNQPMDSRMDSKMDSKTDSQDNPSKITQVREPNPTQVRDGGGWFESVWNLYPEARRGNRSFAENSFKDQVFDIESLNILISNLKNWIHSDQWTKEGGRYIPYLQNWLDRGSWRHCPEPADSASGSYKERDLDEDEIASIQRMMREE